ncbi:uncharacterized protein LOC112518406 [Cynara cardunculus var. scolymus]|uniref:uncharacterized protein LOC112518406 n=1 Tax=Cynara cardunculus var. scolymus TaxID=59895 RepID=UPI000D628F01|nr:uncharacterized protein LOC112518406 [Cynara cardunculus var. scolymus]
MEPVLLHHLSHIKILQGLELRMITSSRLKSCLYSFTSTGGPMYPTRAVHHAAWDALDFLFLFLKIAVPRRKWLLPKAVIVVHIEWWENILDTSSVCSSCCCIHGTDHHRVGTLCCHAYKQYCFRS